MILERLADRLGKALRDTFDDDAAVGWERPQDAAHGDIATPVALQRAKAIGKSPGEIAEALKGSLESCDEVEKVEVAGPGYLNVWLTPVALLGSAAEALTACDAKPTRNEEPPVIVEYSQPNIAKPLGIHHILTTVIGQSIANVYRHLGYHTVSINHIGDWGTQFGKLAVAIELWGDKPAQQCSIDDYLRLYVRFHEEAESDESLEDKAREMFKKLEQGDERLRTFWQTVVDTTMKEIDDMYRRLGIEFDHVHGESFYEDKMTPVIEEGKEKNVFTEGEKGALICEFDDENVPPAIVLKGDGATIYHTRDLATIRYRVDHFHPQSMLYVVDVAQQLYFQQLFAMVRKLGWELPHLEHVIFGRMRFADKKMSTRKGNILKLHDVVEEAVERAGKAIEEHGDSIQTSDPEGLAEMMGTGSVVYGVLSQNRKMDIVFDWGRVLSFDGNSAPYVQYTHARCRSVLRKADDSVPPEPTEVGKIADHERDLLNHLRAFPSALEEMRSSHMPHVLTNYIYSLCQRYNAFYNAENILKADEPDRSLRLYLTYVTAQVLKTGASILTIRVPDRM